MSLCLVSVLGLLLLIGWKGLTYFWPAPLYQWQTVEGHVWVGQLYGIQNVPLSHIPAPSRHQRTPYLDGQHSSLKRYHIKIANREIHHLDFISLFSYEVKQQQLARHWMVIDRIRHGQFYGKPIAYHVAKDTYAQHIPVALAKGLSEAQATREQMDSLVANQIKVLSHALDALRLQQTQREKNHQLDTSALASYQAKFTQLEAQLASAENRLDQLRTRLDQQWLTVEDASGKQVKIPLNQILSAWTPNEMSFGQKFAHWCRQVWHFLSDDPRESNSEGGVFPAIFGTILLVVLMAIIVMPLGIVAAIYLHEYAKNNWLTRVIRVAVVNLAGVPSIVYGVFGLGFFVYTIGSSIDHMFYADRLPAPTFGTPGLLWSALTLALLTLPVVIVTTEEGLSRIPNSVRHGSLALGATQFETIWRVVIPMASPAMITGLILAIARAAGEVAPLMLVGAVKLASSLPVDGEFPFIHLERKFMHLGFHIYDVGFQTSNIEAARPLVYATSFLLVLVIVSLNLTAIAIRNNLREKYRMMEQD